MEPAAKVPESSELANHLEHPADAVYPVVYLDALFVSVRDGVQVQKRAFYVA